MSKKWCDTKPRECDCNGSCGGKIEKPIKPKKTKK